MIEVEELSKRFKTKQALDGVSFTAEDGKVTGFLGPNGAGNPPLCVLRSDSSARIRAAR